MSMALRFGPGPVFIYEPIAATRRWQLHATRALFVLMLLLGLAFAWQMAAAEFGTSEFVAIRKLAALGQYFYQAIATVQIALVLIIAPAATAGAVCLDRARGTLTHMMVTDLADPEIVLGKLAARLLPVFALVAATAPVLALAGLLGRAPFGRQPEPVEALDRIALIILPPALFLAQGAAVTSFGLALATWIPRIGRAVAGSVAAYAAFAFGWLLLLEMGVLTQAMAWAGWIDVNDPKSEQFATMIVGCACPLGGQLVPTIVLEWPDGESRIAFYLGMIGVLLATVLFALALLALTVLSFDRCMGRATVKTRPRFRSDRSEPTRLRSLIERRRRLQVAEANSIP
jgi:hypothetical protein